MTKQELEKIVRDIEEETNRRAAADPDTYMTLVAKGAIAVLEDVYEDAE